jgi:hypothetical protein
MVPEISRHFTGLILSNEVLLKESRQLIGLFWGFKMLPEISRHFTGLISNIEMFL